MQTSRLLTVTGFIATGSLLVTLGSGCAHDASDLDGEEGGAGGKGDLIDPVDDENLGNLVLRAPELSEDDELDLADARFVFGPDNEEVTLDEPLRQLPGSYCLELRNSRDRLRGEWCGIELVAGEITTIELAALKLEWAQAAFDTVVGPRPFPAQASDDDVGFFDWYRSSNGDVLLVVPGDYTLGFGAEVIEQVPLELSAGALEVRDLTAVADAARATVVVQVPEQHLDTYDPASIVYGTFCKLSQEVAGRHSILVRTERMDLDSLARLGPNPDTRTKARLPTNIDEHETYRLDEDVELHFFPFGFEPSQLDEHYQLFVNGSLLTLDVAPGEVAVVEMGRIDVNDVLITREDGTSERVPGDYTISDELGGLEMFRGRRYGDTGCRGDEMAISEVPTATGMDLLPGTYDVLIEYETALGPREQLHTLTVGSTEGL